MNLYQEFYKTVNRQGGHPAFLDFRSKRTVSYLELDQMINDASIRMEHLGLMPGMCVGLHVSSGLDYIVLAFAIWRSGAIVVPIAVELVPAEKDKIYSEIGLDVLISQDSGLKDFKESDIANPEMIFGAFMFLKINIQNSRPDGFAEMNVAFVRFTSGTTSDSKGVVLSHESVYDRIHAANRALDINSSDVVIWLLSMSYHFTVTIVAYLIFGATITACRNHFGDTILKTAEQVRATLIYGAPQHYFLMSQVKDNYDLRPLRLAISTATSLSNDIVETLHDATGIAICQAYGIIELGLPCINTEKPIEKIGSVGPVLPDYQLRLTGSGNNMNTGNIEFKGKGFFDAYYFPWKTWHEFTTDGWFNTGDLGCIDSDGYLYISGRSKEMISVAGLKFFPREVEEVLESHPLIAEAFVFPVFSKRFDEVPHAQIVLEKHSDQKLSGDTVRKYCSDYIAEFKIPQKIGIVDSIEKTASGKLKRQGP